MASRTASPHARRLRWALLAALALHAVLLLRYAPQLFERLETAARAVSAKPQPEPEQALQITPPPPPPRGTGMRLATRLGSGSPETLQAELPPGFFARVPAASSEAMQLSGNLAFSRASGVQIVAGIVSAAVPSAVTAAAARAEPRRVRPARRAAERNAASAASATQDAATKPADAVLDAQAEPPVEAAAATVAEAELEALAALEAAESPVPFLLPPAAPAAVAAPDYDVDAAIDRAARAADESARLAAANTASRRAAPDYRALLPQGALVAPAPLPLGSPAGSNRAAASSEPSGITTFALDAPTAAPRRAGSEADERGSGVARQQFFATLTARLKATNVRLLAEAVRAGPRVTVRMRFLLARNGQVLEVTPVEAVDRQLAARAAAVIRAAALPAVPAVMTRVPLELSFPVEVYR